MKNHIVVDAIKVTQNEKEFYMFKIKANDLLDIAYFNPREIDRESGIQRPFKELRSKEIAEYIDSEDSVLPNNIIVSLKSEFVNFNNGFLEIEQKKDIAFVIDGQHRLRAFKYTSKGDFELPVSGFFDLSLSEIAEIFVKINYNQKPVSKSLVYDLLGISPEIFPQYYEAHEITKVLNETVSSPWFGLIKMLGIGKGIITQATFITALESNKVLDQVLKEFSKEGKIIILSNYFQAIKELFPDQWGHRGYFISKSLSVNAMVRIFPKIFPIIVKEYNSFKVDIIKQFITNIKNIPFHSESITSLGGQKGVKTLSQIMDKCIFGGTTYE